MNQGKWISTEDRMPKADDSIIVSLLRAGARQYWVLEKAGPNMSGGKLYFGYSECDYWQPLELIGD